MILGHLTNTYMLYSLSGKKVRRILFLPLLFFGVLLPDIGDKGLHYIISDSYPGRGVLHSVVMLSAIFIALYFLFNKWKGSVLTVYVGAMLHIAQDLPGATTVLWPFHGGWIIYPPETILEKLWRTYVEMNPFGLWVVEMISLTYCIASLLIRYKRRDSELKADT